MCWSERSKQTKVVCVIGQPCSGKTTYISRNFADKDDHAILLLGTILREVFGERFFLSRGAGYVNPDVEDIVRFLVEKVFRVCITNNLNLVLDGFPRSVDQARWFASLVNYHQLPVEVVWLVADQETLQERASRRCGDNKDLTLSAIHDSTGKVESIVSVLTKFIMVPDFRLERVKT